MKRTAKQSLLICLLLLLMSLAAACGQDSGNGGTEDGNLVAGASGDVMYAYIREINGQTRTVMLDEVELVSQADSARVARLDLQGDKQMYGGSYVYNSRLQQRLYPLADGLVFDLMDDPQQNENNDSSINNNSNNGSGFRDNNENEIMDSTINSNNNNGSGLMGNGLDSSSGPNSLIHRSSGSSGSGIMANNGSSSGMGGSGNSGSTSGIGGSGSNGSTSGMGGSGNSGSSSGMGGSGNSGSTSGIGGSGSNGSTSGNFGLSSDLSGQLGNYSGQGLGLENGNGLGASSGGAAGVLELSDPDGNGNFGDTPQQNQNGSGLVAGARTTRTNGMWDDSSFDRSVESIGKGIQADQKTLYAVTISDGKVVRISRMR